MLINLCSKAEKEVKGSVNVWFCESCTSYHIKAGSVILTFSKEEFSEFVNETWNCFYDNEEIIAIR